MARFKINKTWVIFIFALVFGVVALLLTRSYLASREQALVDAAQVKSEKALVTVVVPNKNLEKGTVLDTSMLAARPVPSDFVGADAIRPEEIANFVGQKLAWSVSAGAPLLKSQIDASGKAFASMLKDGTRAMTIQVDEINSTSGMTVPGNHIDLLLVRDNGNADEVRPLFQNLLVLATGQTVQGSEVPMPAPGQERRAYSTLTLELSPEQASRLVLAQKMGSLRAVLRGTDDRALVAQNAVGANELFGTVPRGAGAAAAPRPAHVEFIIGGQSEKGINQSQLAAVQGQRMAAAAGAPMPMPAAAATPQMPQMPTAPAMPTTR